MLRTGCDRGRVVVVMSVPGSVLLKEGGLAEEWLRFATLALTRLAEAIGALVIATGVVRAMIAWMAHHLPGRNRAASTESIRLGLGRSLGLALEFLLAADILSTAVAPSWDEIGKLAAVATIRTLLNYFLGLELSEEERRREAREVRAAGSGGAI